MIVVPVAENDAIQSNSIKVQRLLQVQKKFRLLSVSSIKQDPAGKEGYILDNGHPECAKERWGDHTNVILSLERGLKICSFMALFAMKTT
jgi:hypothetical protein